MDSVLSRVEHAEVKIDGIRGNNSRATTIFSTSKHPASTLSNYKSLFSGADDPLGGVSPYLDGDEEKVYGVGSGKRSEVVDGEMKAEVTDLYVR